MSAQPHVHSFTPTGRADISEMITPEYAQQLLAMNTANRPLRPARVEEYAAAMASGKWMYNGGTICIADDGTLLDGQNRLTAVVKSGVPMRAIIVRGLPRAAFDTIDRGAPRTNADSLAVSGERHSAVLAAALRWICVIERGGKFANRKLTATQTVEALRTYPEVRRWVGVYSNGPLRKIFDSSLCAVATLFARKYGDEVVERFMKQLALGEDLKRTDPAYELRARAMQSRMSNAKIPPYVFVPLMIKAFRAFVTNKPLGVLRQRDNDEFPAI